MTAEVGSIVGYLRLDRSDWDAELAAAGRKADELARHSPDIRIGVNGPSAIAQLAAVAAAVKRLQDAQGAESVEQRRLADLQDKGGVSAGRLAAAEERVARAHRATAVATTGLAAVYDRNDQATARAVADADRLAQSTKATGDSADKAASQSYLLVDAVALLGPSLLPIAGGAAGAAIGLVGLGAAAYTAFSGIRMEMQNGTQLGMKFSGALGTLNDDFQTLEQTAAAGVLNGFQSAVSSLDAAMPSLNSTIAVLSTQIGGILSHTVGGFVAIFTQMEPLFIQTGQIVDQLATRFEHWATSTTGVSNFVAYAQDALPKVVHVIESLVVIVGHLLEGLAPLGTAALSVFGAIASAIAAIPVPVLQVLVPLVVAGYAAFRTYAGITALLVPVNAALVAHAATAAATSATVVAAVADEATVVAESRLAEAQAVAAASASMVASLDGTASLFQAEAVSAGIASEEITASWAGTASLFATDSSLIAEAAAEQVAAYQLAAVAASVAADEILVASRAEVGAAEVAGLGIASMMGPLGAVVVGLGLLTMAMSSNNTIAEANTQSVNSFTDALVKSKGAIDATVQSQIVKQLTDAHAIADAQTLGISLTTLYAAVTGNKPALEQLNTATEKFAGTGGKAGQVVDRFSTNVNQLAINYATSAASAKVMNDALAQTTVALGAMTPVQRAQFMAASNTATSLAMLGKQYGLTAQQAQTYVQMTGVTAADLANGTANGQLDAALRLVSGAYDTATQSGSKFLAALSAFSTSAGTAADHAALLGAGLVAMQGDALSFTGALANASFANYTLTKTFADQAKQRAQGVTFFRDTEKAAVDLNTGLIDVSKSGAPALISQLDAMQTAAEKAAEALYQHELASKGAGKASADAALIFKTDTYDAIVKDATALGITTDQAQKLAKQYFNMPKTFSTTAHLLGTADVVNTLNGIGTQLSYLTGHPWVSTVKANTSQAATAAAALKAELDAITAATHYVNVQVSVGGVANAGIIKQITQGYATGGTIEHHAAGGPAGTVTGPGSGTSDSVLTWLSAGEEVVNARQSAKFRPLLKAINNGSFKAPDQHGSTTVDMSGLQQEITALRAEVWSSAKMNAELNAQLVTAGYDQALSSAARTSQMHARQSGRAG